MLKLSSRSIKANEDITYWEGKGPHNTRIVWPGEFYVYIYDEDGTELDSAGLRCLSSQLSFDFIKKNLIDNILTNPNYADRIKDLQNKKHANS